MPIYKNWQDFDAMRDKSKVLVIYGAGNNGLRFLNFNKVIPDYFCDKNARKIKNIDFSRGDGGRGAVPVLTLKELLAKLDGRDADILVSNLNEKVIKRLHKFFNKMRFTENTVIYFHHFYNLICRKIIIRVVPQIAINDKYVHIGCLTFDKSIGKRFDLLKNAYFNSDHLSIDELIMLRQRTWEKIFRNGRIFLKNRLQYYPENLKTSGKNQTIYFFWRL